MSYCFCFLTSLTDPKLLNGSVYIVTGVIFIFWWSIPLCLIVLVVDRAKDAL